MKIIKASYTILTDLTDSINTILKPIETAARTCYKSSDKITKDSCIRFCKMLLTKKHEATIEHSSISVKFICDIGIGRELTRHRLCSFCQESTRYINYSKKKFGNEIKIIEPDNSILPKESEAYNYWYEACLYAEKSYMHLLESGIKPEIARNVLPLSTATELVVTANIREWRHLLSLRISEFAHPQMRFIMRSLLDELKQKIPVLFDDINVGEQNDGNDQ